LCSEIKGNGIGFDSFPHAVNLLRKYILPLVKETFVEYLRLNIPHRFNQCRCDVFGADVSFRQGFFKTQYSGLYSTK